MNSDYSNFSYKGITIDPYRIFEIYGITHPAHAHATKKLLRAGRSHKSLSQDIQEAIDSLERWKEMIQEDRDDIRFCSESGCQFSPMENIPHANWCPKKDV